MPPKRTKLTVSKSKSDDESSHSESDTENKFNRKTQQEESNEEEAEHSPTEDEQPEQSEEHLGGRRGGCPNRGGRRPPLLKRRNVSVLDFNYNEMLEKHKELAGLSFEELIKYLIAKSFDEQTKLGFHYRLKTMLQEMNGEIERPPPPSVYRGGRGGFGRYNRYRGGR